MMRSVILLLCLSLCVCLPAAEDAALKPATGEKQLESAAADKVLSAIAARFKANASVSAKIVAEVEDLLGKRTEEGELLLDRPSHIMRKFTKPAEKIWVLNDTYIQEYLPSRKTLYTKDFSKAPEMLALLKAAVTLDVKALSGLFDVSVFESGKDGAHAYRLLLTPKPNTKQPVLYKRIQARIGEQELFFHEIEYLPESGDPTVEKYQEIKAIPKPREDAFVFEVPGDVKRKSEVIAGKH